MSNGSGNVSVQVRRPRRLLAWPEEVERVMRGFTPWSWRRWPRPWPAEEWVPEIDVFERDGKLIIRADVPGMKREDFEVTVEADLLTIKGRREEEKEIREEDYYRCERSTGEFARTVRLPEGTSPEAVEATYEDGVLEISIPRPAAPETKTVKVQIK